MSTETIPARTERQLSDAEWFNILNRVLSGDLVPRNSSGIATDLAGQLGTDSLPWLICRISSGHWNTGDIKVIHPFNGEVAPGHGWMLCDGRVIGQAAYDTEHGAGSWATYVGTSAINGKNLPNMTAKYPVGKATTPQDGSAPITSVGNSAHQINVQHAHNVVHPQAAGTTDTTSSASTTDAINLDIGAGPKNAGVYTLAIATGQARLTASGGDLGAGSEVKLSTIQVVQPDSIETCFYMRVV